jgi:DNA phosphorothioation-dependent restriction protein DptG
MNEPKKNLVDEKELLKKIEKEGEEMLQKLKDSKDVNDKTLLGLMQVGEKEFIKKTGRRMTYAEMRSAYG